MPTISVDKADLWERLGQEYCAHLIQIMFPTWFQVEAIATEDFDKLCFEYGLEIDEDVLFSCLDKATQQHADIFLAQTTEEVEQAIKKGLPAERPVRPGCNIHILYVILTLFVLSVATENRDSCK